MDQRLTTKVRTEINLLRRRKISTAIVGCLIAVFILFSNPVAANTPAATSSDQAKFTVTGYSQNRKKLRGWDILTTGETATSANRLNADQDQSTSDSYVN